MRRWGGATPRADCPSGTVRGQELSHKERGLHTGTGQPALTVILKSVISGLTSIAVIVLGTVNLPFQGWFVPISLRPVLRIVAAYVMARVWSSRG